MSADRHGRTVAGSAVGSLGTVVDRPIGGGDVCGGGVGAGVVLGGCVRGGDVGGGAVVGTVVTGASLVDVVGSSVVVATELDDGGTGSAACDFDGFPAAPAIPAMRRTNT